MELKYYEHIKKNYQLFNKKSPALTLKDKTVSGMLWSFIENFSKLGINFLIGIVLARLLSPREFGLIGMAMILFSLAGTFIDSGFSQALIRKKHCRSEDYSTVFYFNLAVGTAMYLLLYAGAPSISDFFDEPKLTALVRVMGTMLLIDSLTIIQRTILTKKVDFKLQTRISVIASIFSGVVGITMAYLGYGVWSLVSRSLINSGLNSGMLWIWNRWRPSLVFSITSFRELFGFGSKLLASALLNTLWQNIYLLVIGKFYSAESLGIYTRANGFKELPSRNINNVIARVSYPVLSELQDDPVRLKAGYRRLITSVSLITSVFMFGMAASAEAMVLTLVGERWKESILMLQLLCFVGFMYPLSSLNLNILKVKGRSDLFLKLEILKKIISIPVIVVGIIYGIIPMIIGMIIIGQIGYFINSFWSGKMIGYSYIQQIKDLIPVICVSAVMAMAVYGMGLLLKTTAPWMFVIQLFTGAFVIILLCEMFKITTYIYIKDIILKNYYINK